MHKEHSWSWLSWNAATARELNRVVGDGYEESTTGKKAIILPMGNQLRIILRRAVTMFLSDDQEVFVGRRNETKRKKNRKKKKKRRKNNVFKIWAEIFLLAQETKSGATKWQILLPKLVPVHICRISGEKSKNSGVSSSINASNGRNKIIDTKIYYPGIDIFRGSDCFVYWCDPEKGLTWGLNFLNPEDAAAFLNIVQGGKVKLPRSVGNSLEKLTSHELWCSNQHKNYANQLPKGKNGQLWNSLPNTPTLTNRKQFCYSANYCNADNDSLTSKKVSNYPFQKGIKNNSSQDLGQKCDCPKEDSASKPHCRLIDEEKNFVSVKARFANQNIKQESLASSSNEHTNFSSKSINNNGYCSDGEIWVRRNFPTMNTNNIQQTTKTTNLRNNDYNNNFDEKSSAPAVEQEMSRLISEGIMQMSLDSDLLKKMIEPLSSTSGSEHDCEFTTSKNNPLIMKSWLDIEKGKLIVRNNEKWARYWCCVRGIHASFYEVIKPASGHSNDQEMSSLETGIDQYCLKSEATFLVELRNCLCLPVPDYPRRENVFCFTTHRGQSFLIQVSSEIEVRSWVQTLNSTSAAIFSQSQSRHNTIYALEKEIAVLIDRIVESKQDDLEIYNVDLFKCRTYLASIKNKSIEIDPNSMLNSATKDTRLALANQGVFNPSSMFALINLKKSICLKNVNDLDAQQTGSPLNFVPVRLPRKQIQEYNIEICEKLNYHLHISKDCGEALPVFGFTVKTDKTTIESNSSGVKVTVTRLNESCPASRAGLVKGDEFLFINGRSTTTMTSSDVEQTLQNSFDLCLIVRTKQLNAPPTAIEFVKFEDVKLRPGWSCFTRKKFENSKSIDTDLWFNEARRPAAIFRTNSKKLSTDIIKRDLMRQKRLSLPNMERGIRKYTETQVSRILKNFETRIIDSNDLSNAAVPLNVLLWTLRSDMGKISTIYHFPEKTPKGKTHEKKVSWNDEMEPADDQMIRSTSNIKLSPIEKIEKVVLELVDTEKAYVKDLDDLLNFYLYPLSNESLIGSGDLEKLIDSCTTILKFHRGFLEEICDTIFWANNLARQNEIRKASQLKNSLLHLGGLFLTAAIDFKVYSTFCTNYFRIQKLLREENNETLRAFLTSRNFKRQHSFTLESYLIKPVQRVLRYPLFLSQIKALTEQGRPENVQISDALDKMEKVAEYINEMQRVYEEYGDLFSKIQYANLEICDLLMFGEIEWLNPFDENGKKRSFSAQDCLLFVFKSGVLLLQQQNEKRKVKSGNEKLQNYRFIPVSQLEVNGSDIGSSDERYIWVLIHIDFENRSEKIYHFSNKNLEMKQEFLKSIRKACFYSTKMKNTKYTSDDHRYCQSQKNNLLTPLAKNDIVQSNDSYDNFVAIRTKNCDDRCETQKLDDYSCLNNGHDLKPCRSNCYCSKNVATMMPPCCSLDENNQRPNSYSSQSDPGYGSCSGENNNNQVTNVNPKR
uniref:Uncharacterized protein n=1 Tax=Romanomermis culicivorax TaxID=13658 RepID=A0A915L2E6_ROMCU